MIKIIKYNEVSPEEVFARTVNDADVSDTVAAIIADVRKRGDEAVKEYGLPYLKQYLLQDKVINHVYTKAVFE